VPEPRSAGRTADRDMPTLTDLGQLESLVRRAGDKHQLYVRWSRGPASDLDDGEQQYSQDELTGVRMPGLSANPLLPEAWWGSRPLRLWLARRLIDYCHLRDVRGPGVRPWVLEGDEQGRGPDNEPLVRCLRALAWLGEAALTEAEQAVACAPAAGWGPLNRHG
jgi:hypothetical protein